MALKVHKAGSHSCGVTGVTLGRSVSSACALEISEEADSWNCIINILYTFSHIYPKYEIFYLTEKSSLITPLSI